MCIFCNYNRKIVGKFLGYPKCCINWDSKNHKKHKDEDAEAILEDFNAYQDIIHKKTFGIGFIPCPSCAKKVVENNLSLESLIRNRICSIPFPYAGDDNEISIKEFKEYIKHTK